MLHKLKQARLGFLRRLATIIEALGDRGDQRGSNDHAFSHARQRTHLLLALHAEADGNRQLRMRFEPRHMLADGRDVRRRRAGDARDGHIVDETRGIREHGRQALGIGSRRGKPNEVQPTPGRGRAKLLVFLRRHIHHDQTIGTGVHRIGDEAVNRIHVYGIVVAHKHYRCCVISFAELSNHGERLFHGLAALERPHGGRLDRRPISHGVGEGHANLDDIGARARQPLEHGERGLVVRVAGSDEGYEPSAALALQRGEFLVDPRHAHISIERCSATAKMSLSPRPHMFMTRRLSAGSVGASFRT